MQKEEGNEGKYVEFLHQCVILSVKVLAFFMVLVIWLALIDVIVHFYQRIEISFPSMFSVEYLIATLGDFLAVLIAIEIFLNIIFYLQKDQIYVTLVLTTALTAVARKVIILDYQQTSPLHIFGIAAIIASVGLAFWFVTHRSKKSIEELTQQ